MHNRRGPDFIGPHMEYLKAQVAAYKYPRKVWLLDALPEGPTGKVLKREIRPPAARESTP